MQKITPFLWYDNEAEEAANFYVSIFSKWHSDTSKIGRIIRYGKAGAEVSGRLKDSIMTVEFMLAGQNFMAINGGKSFKFSEAVSFIINCKTQEEVDHYWEKLTEGGDEKAQICGWLKDKYGLSWQVVPIVLDEMLSDKDPEKAERVMKAMLEMKKIEISGLKKAYEEK